MADTTQPCVSSGGCDDGALQANAESIPRVDLFALEDASRAEPIRGRSTLLPRAKQEAHAARVWCVNLPRSQTGATSLGASAPSHSFRIDDLQTARVDDLQAARIDDLQTARKEQVMRMAIP